MSGGVAFIIHWSQNWRVAKVVSVHGKSMSHCNDNNFLILIYMLIDQNIKGFQLRNNCLRIVIYNKNLIGLVQKGNGNYNWAIPLSNEQTCYDEMQS